MIHALVSLSTELKALFKDRVPRSNSLSGANTDEGQGAHDQHETTVTRVDIHGHLASFDEIGF
jgi:hypothetical protein